MMRTKRIAAIALVALCAAGALAADEGWVSMGESEGVQVWKREVAGSPFLGIKGSGDVDVPPVMVALVLLDEARSPEWVDSLAESSVVRQFGPDDYVEYNRVAMPWPINDREFLTRVRMSYDAQTHGAVIRSEPYEAKELPPKPKTIRGTLRGTYLLEPIADGKGTRLTVEIHSDPAGWLPGWLVNFFQKDWARETIVGIRKQAKKPDLTRPEEFKDWLGRFDVPAAQGQPAGTK